MPDRPNFPTGSLQIDGGRVGPPGTRSAPTNTSVAPEQHQCCVWCGSTFEPRATGGRPQLYCDAACRKALERAAWRWVIAAVYDGRLSVAELKNHTSGWSPVLIDALHPGQDPWREFLAWAARREGEILGLLPHGFAYLARRVGLPTVLAICRAYPGQEAYLSHRTVSSNRFAEHVIAAHGEEVYRGLLDIYGPGRLQIPTLRSVLRLFRDDTIAAIRADGASRAELAQRFGVHLRSVTRILNSAGREGPP